MEPAVGYLEVHANVKNVRRSARKVRLVADAVRGLTESRRRSPC